MEATDTDAVGALLAALALVATPAAFRVAALDGLRKLIALEVAAYYEIDPASGEPNVVVFPADALFPGAERAWAQTLADDPLFRHYDETKDGSAVKLSDFVPDDELPTHPKYEPIYRRLGMHRKMSMVVEEQAPPGASAVTRPRISLFKGGDDFTERDRSLMNALRVPLARLRRDVEDRTRARDLDGAARESGAGPWGVVVVRPDAGAVEAHERLENVVVRRVLTPVDELDAGFRERVRGAPLGLTAREAEVLDLLSQGKRDGEIAEALGISPRTVGKHLEHIYEKLEVQNRAEAVYRAGQLRGER